VNVIRYECGAPGLIVTFSWLPRGEFASTSAQKAPVAGNVVAPTGQSGLAYDAQLTVEPVSVVALSPHIAPVNVAPAPPVSSEIDAETS
jgi:hypothetical protein